MTRAPKNCMIDAFLQQNQNTLNEQLNAYFDTYSSSCPQLNDACRYVLAKPGKQLRAHILFATGHLARAPEQLLNRAALAIELVHTYSLIHDDLPAMDNAELRRGQASCHNKFSEATAILVGDGLLTNAFSWLSSCPTSNDEDKLKLMACIAHLSQAAGSLGMVAGQSLDLNAKPVDVDALSKTHQLKTGAMFEASVLMGAVLGDVSSKNKEQLRLFIKHLGLAYQIQDDILDEIASTDTLGKPALADKNNDKITYVSLLGLNQAKVMMTETFSNASEALKGLEGDTQYLEQICKRIESRMH